MGYGTLEEPLRGGKIIAPKRQYPQGLGLQGNEVQLIIMICYIKLIYICFSPGLSQDMSCATMSERVCQLHM